MRQNAEELLLQLAENATIDDLPEDLRWIAERLGVKAAWGLAVCFSGTYFYIPKTINNALKKRYCQLNYDGHNARRLAILMEVSEPTVYKWVAQDSAPTARQISLFD